MADSFFLLRICNAITRSHPLRSDVYKSDLDKSLPNIQEIQAAHVKLKQLCVNGMQDCPPFMMVVFLKYKKF